MKYFDIYIRQRAGSIDISEIVPDNINQAGLEVLGFTYVDVVKSNKLKISPENARLADGTDYLVSEKVAASIDRIWLNSLQLNVLRDLTGGQIDIILLDPNEKDTLFWIYDGRASTKTITQSGDLSLITFNAEKTVDSKVLVLSEAVVSGVVTNASTSEPENGVKVTLTQFNEVKVNDETDIMGSYSINFITEASQVMLTAESVGFEIEIVTLDVDALELIKDISITES